MNVSNNKTNWQLYFHKQRGAQRRFEAARFLRDAFVFNSDLLPVTDFRTARQKLQCAFAAELLCPIATLQDFHSENASPDWMDDAAAYFNVSTYVINHQWDNQRLYSAL